MCESALNYVNLFEYVCIHPENPNLKQNKALKNILIAKRETHMMFDHIGSKHQGMGIEKVLGLS